MTNICKLSERHKDLEEKFQQLIDRSYITDAKFKGRQYKKATVVCCSYGCRATN